MKKLTFLLLLSFAAVKMDAQADSAMKYFSSLFDSSRTFADEIGLLNKFSSFAFSGASVDSSFHSGQTDYTLKRYHTGFSVFSSTTYYNSPRAPLMVNQVMYGGKIIFISNSGGQPYRTEKGYIYDYHNPLILQETEKVTTRAAVITAQWPVAGLTYIYDHEKKLIAEFSGSAEKLKVRPLTDTEMPNLFFENH